MGVAGVKGNAPICCAFSQSHSKAYGRFGEVCLANAHLPFMYSGHSDKIIGLHYKSKSDTIYFNTIADVHKSRLRNERDTFPQALEHFKQPQIPKRRAQQTGATCCLRINCIAQRGFKVNDTLACRRRVA